MFLNCWFAKSTGENHLIKCLHRLLAQLTSTSSSFKVFARLKLIFPPVMSDCNGRLMWHYLSCVLMHIISPNIKTLTTSCKSSLYNCYFKLDSSHEMMEFIKSGSPFSVHTLHYASFLYTMTTKLLFLSYAKRW